MRAALLGFGQRTENKWRPAACRDSANNIFPAHAAFFDRERAAAPIVFRALDAARQRRHSPGNDSLHHVGRRAERRRDLARIENAEPPARSGADIKKPAAIAQTFRDHLERAREQFRLLPQRFLDETFFFNEELD